jgi:hypothetical protein
MKRNITVTFVRDPVDDGTEVVPWTFGRKRRPKQRVAP